MQGSLGIGTGFSSPTRFNEDDTIAGVFIGPRCDVEKEEDNLRRLQHALGDVQHELCAPSVNQLSTPSDVADQHLTEGENADALSLSETDENATVPSPSRVLRPRKRATPSPAKPRRRSRRTGQADRTSLPNASTSWTPVSETDPSPSASNTIATPTPTARRQTRASTAATLASQSIPEDNVVTHQSLPPPSSRSEQITTVEQEDGPPATTRETSRYLLNHDLTLPPVEESITTQVVNPSHMMSPEPPVIRRTFEEACTPPGSPLEVGTHLPSPFITENRPTTRDESGYAPIGADMMQSRSPSPRRSPRRHRDSQSPSRHQALNSAPPEQPKQLFVPQADANPDLAAVSDPSCTEKGFEIVSQGQTGEDPNVSCATPSATNPSHIDEPLSENENEDAVPPITSTSVHEIEEQPHEDSVVVLSPSKTGELLTATQAVESATTSADSAKTSASVASLALVPNDALPRAATPLPPIQPNVLGAEPRKVSDTSTARTVSSSASAAEVRGILSGRVKQPITPSRTRVSPSKPIISPRKNPLLVSASLKKPLAVGNSSKPAPSLDPRFRFNPFLPSTPIRSTPAKAPGTIGPPVLVSAKKPIQSVEPSSGFGQFQSPVRPKPIPFTLIRSSPGKTSDPSQTAAGLGPGIGSVNRKRARGADEALVETPGRRQISPHRSSAAVLPTTPSPSRKRVREDDDDADPEVDTPTPSPNKRARPTPTFAQSSPEHDDGDDTEKLALKLRQMKADVASWDNESSAKIKPARNPKFLDNSEPSHPLNIRNTRPATVSGAARSNSSKQVTQPPRKAPVSSPHRRTTSSTLTRSNPNPGRSTFTVSVSPVRPTSRPVPVPSPLRSGFGGARTSPSKPSTLFSSPIRPSTMAGPSASVAPAVRKASSNENIFQTGPVLPSSVQRGTSSRVASGTTSHTQRPTTAATAKVDCPATTTPSAVRPTDIPFLRGLTGASNRPISRLPRPTTSLVKPPVGQAPNPFMFGAGEPAAFTPMNINVSLAYVAGDEDVSLPQDNMVPLGMTDKQARRASHLTSSEQEQPPHDANVSSPSAHGPLSQSFNTASSPAVSEASSLDPLGMSPIPRRPKRASRSGQSSLSVSFNGEPSYLPKPQPKKKSKGVTGETLPVSGMTATALGKLTTNNTKRNEMRVAELDRRFVLLDIPRPPSPGSRIRTVAQKQSDEAEMARQRRARNRSIMKGEILPLEAPTNVQLPLKHPRAPGDEEEYHTPKKIRQAMEIAEREQDGLEDRISDSVPLLGEVEEEDRRRREKGKGKREQPSDSSDSLTSPPAKRPKFVRWDKLIATAGPSQSRDCSGSEGTDSAEGRALRSALSKKAFYELDRHGNTAAAYQPMEGLKKDRVVVTKLIYADDPNDDPEIRNARAVTLKGGVPVSSGSK